MEVGELKIHLGGMLHGIDISDIPDIELVMERAGNTMLGKIDPIETMREAALSSTIHDDVYNYALPSDYKDLVDLAPQDNRTQWDKVTRNSAGRFDREKAIRDQVISIEGSEGSKIARINWRSRAGTVLNTMDSYNGNGTWASVGSASTVETDTIFHVSGGGSVRFTHTGTGGGIQTDDMTAVDLSDHESVGDVFVWMYFTAVPTSVTAIWGNDLSTNYWTGVAQTTQADGTAFRVGWNLLKWSWSAATETGTVNASTIDSFKITLASDAALGTIRVDNILFSIGRNFDMKYYSKYLIKSTAGLWLPRTTSDDDICVLDTDAIQIYLCEILIAASQQQESQISTADDTWARRQINGDPQSNDTASRLGLYTMYRKRYPSMARRITRSYTSGPRMRRGLRR